MIQKLLGTIYDFIPPQFPAWDSALEVKPPSPKGGLGITEISCNLHLKPG